jgi:Fe-S cluster assembly protein SufD
LASPALSTPLEPGWLAERRAVAAARTGELSLPSFKGAPGWEFTPLPGLDLDAYGPSEAGDAAARDRVDLLFAPREGARTLEQVDGRALWAPAASRNGHRPAAAGEAIVLPLDTAAERHPDLVRRYLGTVVPGDDVFVARNEAGWTGGAFVYVPRGVRLEEPVVLTATQDRSGESLNWRTLIVLEEGAEAEVWEQYLSADAGTDALFNAVAELSVGPNATLRYVSGQALAERSWFFGTQRAQVERDGTLDWAALGFGSARGKVRMETNLAGQGASARVTGAYAGHGRQHLDFDTTQEHAAPNTTSDLAFRGVLDGRATAVWRGMIRVDPGAQRTDAFQDNRNLLLSKGAHADAIPGLEIEANDVRCTHAAAIAQIDRDQLFYLMSHGLAREVATRLVIDGFLQALVQRFAEGPVRDTMSDALERRLQAILG